MKNSVLITLIATYSFLSSCDTDRRVNREVIDEMKKSTEIKKVSEVDLINFAMNWGDEISKEAQGALINTLQEAIAERGLEGAVEFCHTEALPIIQKVADKNKVQVRRVSLNNRNPANTPNEMEKTLLEAYAYNVENGVENKPNVQKMDNGETLLFTKAITIPGGLCLNCHGDPEKDIAPSTLGKIGEKYPNDKAIGYKVGDLRGMWSISLPRKEVIKSM